MSSADTCAFVPDTPFIPILGSLLTITSFPPPALSLCLDNCHFEEDLTTPTFLLTSEWLPDMSGEQYVHHELVINASESPLCC